MTEYRPVFPLQAHPTGDVTDALGRLHAWVAPSLTEQAVALLNLRQSAEALEFVTIYDKADELVVELPPGDDLRTVRIHMCRLDLAAPDMHGGRAGELVVSWGGYPHSVTRSRDFAAAILRACDEAERLQAEYRAQLQPAVKGA